MGLLLVWSIFHNFPSKSEHQQCTVTSICRFPDKSTVFFSGHLMTYREGKFLVVPGLLVVELLPNTRVPREKKLAEQGENQ